MESEQSIMDWLSSLPRGADVGIDEGGLRLVAVLDDKLTGDFYEIGGIPEEIETRKFCK